ncbi:MAG: hypothetical protein IKX39_07740 [Muribaculaceae bacterium]|nr:hypothetical protein [Muribaculaceae bacterium]
MMKKYLWIIVAFVLICGCKPQSREQIAEKVGQAMKAKVEKNVNERIKKMLEGMLEHPESYQPISTDLAIVTNNMIVYDSQAFVALRDLDNRIDNFRKEFGKDTVSRAARNELEAMHAMVGVVVDKLNDIEKRPVEFEAIDAYHQFYAKDKLNRKLKRGYHFIIHKDNRITLLCDQEQMDRVQAFAEKLLTQGVNVIEDE